MAVGIALIVVGLAVAIVGWVGDNESVAVYGGAGLVVGVLLAAGANWLID
jgi:hypothetical protein